MKIRKIWGAGGTGKSYSLARYLVELEEENPLFNFMILSYTHVGKNEIYKKYLQFKGEDISKFNPFKNYDNCRTFHSLVYDILRNYLSTEIKKKKITDFIEKEKVELELLEELKELSGRLFMRDFQDKLKAFEVNFEELSKKVLNLNHDRKKYLYSIFEKLNQLNEGGEEGVNLNEIVRLVSSLREDELVFLILLLEGNIYDTGYIIDPFKQRIVDPKLDFVVKKYYSLFKIDLKERLKEVLEIVLDEDYASPLHPIYNIRKLYETLIDKGFKKELGFYNVIILDEAQDVPEIFVEFLKKFYDAEELIMAGDPYQAIFLDLGFNSQFIQIDDKTEVVKTLWRYSYDYLFNIKRYIRFPIYTIDLLKEFKSSQRTKFEEIIIYSSSFKREDSYLKAGLEVIKNYGLINSTDKVFLTNNIKKYVLGIKEIIFLPYKEFYDIKIKTLNKYLVFLLLAQEFEDSLKDKAKELFDELVNYYGIYPSLKYLYLFNDEDEERKFWNKWQINKEKQNIEDLFKNQELKKEVYKILRDNYLIQTENGKDIKGFVIYLTTHRSKGKTLEEDVFYIPSKGLYYYLEKEFKEYYFIHSLLKYVSLTRPSRRLFYISVRKA